MQKAVDIFRYRPLNYFIYCLYAHIFKIPKGHYVLGSSIKDTTANLFYLAVQGQTDATIGDNEQAAIGNAVVDADFLTEAPTIQNWPSALSKAEFNFTSNYDTSKNTVFEVNTKYIESEAKNYLALTFIDNPRFVDYLFLNARGQTHIYYLNDVRTDRAQYVVPRE